VTRWAAFLRGINLGSRRLTMAELRGHVEALGFDDVSTFIASGNVVFDAPGRADALEQRLEEHLSRALGFSCETFVRSLIRLAEVMAEPDIDARKADGFNPHVLFLKGALGAKGRKELQALEGHDDAFLVLEREVLWFRRGRLSDSTITDRHLGLVLGARGYTARNLNTVQRMLAKCG
jgi:uncharacterized protein (DUF1697 family)